MECGFFKRNRPS
ncbi:hypothetical protein F3157_16430 [Virgibacillus dakarensis]|nr:hypothetical protein [Virgibacillus dakarensis]